MDINKILVEFDYDKDTGKLYRVLAGGVRVESGTDCNGYVRSRFDGNLEYNHRLAWAWYYREQPPEYIDHINRDKSDNSINNLRACSLSQNQHNRKLSRNSTTGYTGVTYVKNRGKYKATIYKDSKPIYLGLYKTPEEASRAYERAKANLVSFE